MQCSAAGSALARGYKACRRCPAPVLAAPHAIHVSLLLGISCRRSALLQKCKRGASFVASASREERSQEPSQGPSVSGRSPAEPSGISKFISSAAKMLGVVGLMAFAMLSGPTRAAHARDRALAPPATARIAHAHHSSNPVISDLAAASATAAEPASAAEALAADATSTSSSSAEPAVEAAYRAYLERISAQVLAENPGAAGQPELLARLVRARALGTPLSFDELMRSRVVAPEDVPNRNSRQEVAEQIRAIIDQYDREDFDLGIKQFMLEAKVKAKLEAASRGSSRDRAAPKDYEEALAAELFASEAGAAPKEKAKTEDMVDDAFTTEVVEEALALFGDANSVKTTWRTQDVLRELSYTQLWSLVEEGHIAKLRFYGPEKNKVLATTRASAPGGVRVCKVVLPPDPTLLDHLSAHGVVVEAGASEDDRLRASLIIQMLRYTAPFLVISGLFWVLHSWLLDPVPNKFRRQEFIRYRREMLHVASKLNFRTPAREVRIDTTSPDFIKWDDINGIDEVKREITEIIEYLRNPGLLRSRGVARIGGVLLAGAPGTGKTLLAKAIAAEGGVRMFTCSGTDFYDVYSGVGARRVRETFDRLRNSAPAILFIDEFDALGAARGAQASGDESASIINELLVQMDGFEDNRGIVVLGATNRPGAIDSALIRPGRFDRIIYMPLPDAAGRAKIMQVHARNKAVDPNINWYEVARAMAGFTGADVMGLMARAARMAARQGREAITEDDIYAAMENKTVEAMVENTSVGGGGGLVADDPTPDNPEPIPPQLRKSIATYEAGKALVAYITPEYEEIARVSVCPLNIISGFTLFVEDEDKNVNAILTRSELEGRMVVSLAGRCAEKLVMGEGNLTGMGSPDLFHANLIAREMIMSMGMGRRTGPVDLLRVVGAADGAPGGETLRAGPEMADEDPFYYHTTDMSTEQARVALSEVVELLEAAEAKAMYGLAMNWKPLEALTQALLDRGTLTGKEVAHILETNGVIHFPDPYTGGFGWDPDGSLRYPFKPEMSAEEQQQKQAEEAAAKAKAEAEAKPVLTGALAKTWFAGTEHDAPRTPDGRFAHGWHWNMPYSVRKTLPDWYKKELDRYSY
ncbi:ATP-dependent zinc metalloprotease FTSH 1 [Pleodorina starrii]|nr:ATP-dependent zinc metalloprotease FTSH 1 [Pleodorina starrii]